MASDFQSEIGWVRDPSLALMPSFGGGSLVGLEVIKIKSGPHAVVAPNGLAKALERLSSKQKVVSSSLTYCTK